MVGFWLRLEFHHKGEGEGEEEGEGEGESFGVKMKGQEVCSSACRFSKDKMMLESCSCK